MFDKKPLSIEKEQRKRPIILYLIIEILLIVIIILSIFLAIKSSDKTEDKKEEKNEDKKKIKNKIKKDIINPIHEENFISVKDSFYIDDPDNGANSYHGIGNHLESKYYKILDVYNMKPNNNRSILTNFKIYQYNLDVLSSADYTEETLPFVDEIIFGSCVKENINEGNIIIALYNDWAGQYAAIIGIDDMGTELTNDLADAYDMIIYKMDILFGVLRDSLIYGNILIFLFIKMMKV